MWCRSYELICIVCEKRKHEYDGIFLPYGSEFDCDFVCNECLTEAADKYIKSKREEKK